MSESYRILILGASYGSLLATKALFAGHQIHLVCLPAEAELINREGAVVRLPVRGREAPVEIRTKDLPGKLTAGGADTADPSAYDLIGMAMQEPQYGTPGVRELMAKVAASGKPCMSIMNMPPLAFMRRILGGDAEALEPAYTDPTVWSGFDPDLITLASPDPQAFRPPGEPVNVLQVSLPTNFKVARFKSDAHTRILRDLEAGIDAARFDADDGPLALPVKLKVHDSLFVPLAKWPMLLTGNYRCIQDGTARSIRDAVHTDPAASERIYGWVSQVCQAIGAAPGDLVPFAKYADAAQGLVRPSSAARALDAGARNIERVDKLVRIVAASRGMTLADLDRTVALVDAKLAVNRAG